MRSLDRFNTPNAHNTLGLFAELGLDPTADWTFTMGTPPSGRTKSGPTLHLSDVRQCIEFFEALVSVTAASAARQFP